ncbi:MAG: histidine phosphatase family protein [Deltaproteobacteria bacterium]|nr:histidine phosphatase family protein [Deltaproteobacteria bacterium]
MTCSARLYLIRHGQVVNHHEMRYNGHSDVDITEAGVAQMHRLSEFLSAGGRRIEAVYSSDLKRAARGARMIGERLGLKPVELEALRELNLGRWDGLTRDEAVSMYPEEAHFSFKDLALRSVKGGETLEDLKVRVLPAIASIVSSHAGGEAAIVAHGGVNRVFLCDVMGLAIGNFFAIEQDYGCLNVIDCFEDGGRVVKLLNGGPNQDLNPTRPY